MLENPLLSRKRNDETFRTDLAFRISPTFTPENMGFLQTATANKSAAEAVCQQIVWQNRQTLTSE